MEGERKDACCVFMVMRGKMSYDYQKLLDCTTVNNDGRRSLVMRLPFVLYKVIVGQAFS